MRRWLLRTVVAVALSGAPALAEPEVEAPAEAPVTSAEPKHDPNLAIDQGVVSTPLAPPALFSTPGAAASAGGAPPRRLPGGIVVTPSPLREPSGCAEADWNPETLDLGV